MKKINLYLILIVGMIGFMSCEKQANPQPTVQTNPVAQDSLVNYFEQQLIGTWKQEYRVKKSFPGGITQYDTVPAIDTTWTVTFTSNNPEIPANGLAPYKKDASGKLTEYSNSTPNAYITKWYGTPSGNTGNFYTGTIWLPHHGNNQSRLYIGDHLEIEVDYIGYYYIYILKKI